jgi:hypothetical protein
MNNRVSTTKKSSRNRNTVLDKLYSGKSSKNSILHQENYNLKNHNPKYAKGARFINDVYVDKILECRNLSAKDWSTKHIERIAVTPSKYARRTPFFKMRKQLSRRTSLP